MFTFTHRHPPMQLDKPRTALVLADMQIEFLEENTGTYYELIADALSKRDVTSNLERLLATAQEHASPLYIPCTGIIPRMVNGSFRLGQSTII